MKNQRGFRAFFALVIIGNMYSIHAADAADKERKDSSLPPLAQSRSKFAQIRGLPDPFHLPIIPRLRSISSAASLPSEGSSSERLPIEKRSPRYEHFLQLPTLESSTLVAVVASSVKVSPRLVHSGRKLHPVVPIPLPESSSAVVTD